MSDQAETVPAPEPPKAEAKAEKPKNPLVPQSGGSYARQKDGSLKQTQKPTKQKDDAKK